MQNRCTKWGYFVFYVLFWSEQNQKNGYCCNKQVGKATESLDTVWSWCRCWDTESPLCCWPTDFPWRVSASESLQSARALIYWRWGSWLCNPHWPAGNVLQAQRGRLGVLFCFCSTLQLLRTLSLHHAVSHWIFICAFAIGHKEYVLPRFPSRLFLCPCWFIWKTFYRSLACPMVRYAGNPHIGHCHFFKYSRSAKLKVKQCRCGLLRGRKNCQGS